MHADSDSGCLADDKDDLEGDDRNHAFDLDMHEPGD
jgi:hypothetical protein